MGVEITDINSKTNDMNSRIDRGVAGLNIARQPSQLCHMVCDIGSDYGEMKISDSTG